MKRVHVAMALPVLLAATGGCRQEPGGAMARFGADARLAAAAPGKAAQMQPEVTVQRLSTSQYADFYASSISPDGRYMAMIDWATGNLAVRDLSTDTVHPVTDVQNGPGKPFSGAGVSVFSRDGRRIISSWEYRDRTPAIQIRVVDFELDAAGVPRVAQSVVIFHNPELSPYFVFDTSPDGSQVLVKARTTSNTYQLTLISTHNGAYRALKSFDWREPNRAAFSPDGRYVTYDFPPDRDSPETDVFVVSVDGSYEAKVVESAALVGWHSRGNILFQGRRGDTSGLWRVPMSDGRPTGPTELVKAQMWVEPLGFAGDRFYYGIEVDPQRLYAITMNAADGKRVGAPVPVDDPGGSRIRGWDWSADGRFLAYSAPVRGGQGSVMVIRSDRGDVVQTLHLDLQPTRIVRWEPDGKSLIVYANDSKDRPGFRRIDLKTGSYRTILTNDQLQDPTPRGNFDIAPDGRTIFFATSANDDVRWNLVAYDLETRVSRSITPVEWRVRGGGVSWFNGQISVSPDGRRLALVAPDTISGDRWVGTIPVQGGSFTPLARLDRAPFFGPEWAADGRSVVIWTGFPTDWKGWIVGTGGVEPRPLQLMERVFPRGMTLHPDGRRIALLAGDPRGEVWVMDGLGGATVTAKTGGAR